MVLQHCRTEAAAVRATSLTEGMLNTLEREFAVRMPNVDTSAYAMMWLSLGMYPHILQSIRDLGVVIVENQTPLDFVTSDDPVVYTSRLHAERLRTNNFGMAAAGVFFVFPLSPRLLLLCYDRDVYRIRGVHRYRTVVRDVQDVRSCNELQLLNASKNVYFSNWEQRAEVALQFRSTESRRRMSRTRFLTYVECGETHDEKLFRAVEAGTEPPVGDTLIRAATTHIFPTRWLSKLVFRWRIKFRRDGSMAGYARERT